MTRNPTPIYIKYDQGMRGIFYASLIMLAACVLSVFIVTVACSDEQAHHIWKLHKQYQWGAK
jgi:hypothetical protein